jgi:hypothetical protein
MCADDKSLNLMAVRSSSMVRGALCGWAKAGCLPKARGSTPIQHPTTFSRVAYWQYAGLSEEGRATAATLAKSGSYSYTMSALEGGEMKWDVDLLSKVGRIRAGTQVVEGEVDPRLQNIKAVLWRQWSTAVEHIYLY